VARPAAGADRGRRPPQRYRAGRPALILYLDTSAFVKLLVPEPGSFETAERWLRARRRVSSRLLYPEARAALARARRIGRLDASRHHAAIRRLEALWDAVYRIDLTGALAHRAGELADRHDLRAYDAVHLASVEHARDRDLVVASHDVDLLQAAQSMGFATTPRPL
jgi:predicted nucleic acid-binding protein